MFPREYALYPHFSPRDLPFSMNTSGTFRLRRVGEWLSGSFREDLDMAEGLATGKCRFVADFKYVFSRWSLSLRTQYPYSRTVQLKHLLLRSLPDELDRANVVIKAS